MAKQGGGLLGAIIGAVVGFFAGTAAAPVTAGASVPVVTLIGAILGFLGSKDVMMWIIIGILAFVAVTGGIVGVSWVQTLVLIGAFLLFVRFLFGNK